MSMTGNIGIGKAKDWNKEISLFPILKPEVVIPWKSDDRKTVTGSTRGMSTKVQCRLPAGRQGIGTGG